MKSLILGGVRSGKSRLAEQLAIESGLSVTYIATATADDIEMQARIDSHRKTRPTHWTVIEEPMYLAKALKDADKKGQCILLDCLTLWLTNLLTASDSIELDQEVAALLETLPLLSSQLIMVSNETNMGIVPMGALSRRYCDEAGRLHQLLAQRCDRVILTVAGLPLILKGVAL